MLGFVLPEQKAETTLLLLYFRYFTLSRVWYLRGTQRRFPSKYIRLEMHSKRRYKICILICSVTLGELKWVFSKLQALRPRLISITPGSETFFLILPLRRIFNPKILGFLLQKKAQLGKWKMNIKLQKILGNLLDKSRKLYNDGTVT